MTKALVLLLAIVGIVVWTQRNSPGFGEWLRRMTDGPTNLVLLGTSGFEQEGRDPAKRP
jgi:hypothetical protein